MNGHQDSKTLIRVLNIINTELSDRHGLKNEIKRLISDEENFQRNLSNNQFNKSDIDILYYMKSQLLVLQKITEIYCDNLSNKSDLKSKYKKFNVLATRCLYNLENNQQKTLAKVHDQSNYFLGGQ